jgi:RluA family pseudouridine synthase
VNTVRLSREWRAIEVLYEDDDLLALNKPAGLLAVPDRFDKTRPDLMSLLQAARPAEFLANVHRLDFNTSGVFVVARNSETFRKLVRQFRDRATRKTYVAICHGCPAVSVVGAISNRGLAPTDRQSIDLPIGRHPKIPGHARIDHAHGSNARSVVSVREKFRGFALVEVVIETGRMHQVRVHLQAIGCPLVGDTDYGGEPLLLSQLKRGYKPKDDESERPLLDRPALHAEQLTLIRPMEGEPPGEPLTITAPRPKDLTVALKYLRRFAPPG